MSTRTKQEVFSRVYHHFIDMRSARGITEENNCAFRGAHGSRCAVGLFMTDEEAANADARKSGVGEILRNGYCAELEGQEAGFIDHIQYAHDNGISPGIFEMELRDVAKIHDLLVVGIPQELASPPERAEYYAGEARKALARAHGLAVCSCGALGARSWNGRWAPQCEECYDTEIQERREDD